MGLRMRLECVALAFFDRAVFFGLETQNCRRVAAWAAPWLRVDAVRPLAHRQRPGAKQMLAEISMLWY